MSPSHAEMRKQAKTAEVEGWHKDAGGYLVPDEGWEGGLMVVEARAGLTSNNYQKYSIWFEALPGSKGAPNRFWDTVSFSASPVGNSISYEKLECLGIPESFWDGGPSDDEVIAKMTGRKAYGRVTYDENDRDPNRPWIRVTLTEMLDETAGVFPTAEPAPVPTATAAPAATEDTKIF